MEEEGEERRREREREREEKKKREGAEGKEEARTWEYSISLQFPFY
jgi:hypothetical protein